MSPMAAIQLYRDGLRRARHSCDPLGEDLLRARPQTERGDAVNIASSQRRTRKKLAPVTASYVTWRSSRCLPPSRLIWLVRTTGMGGRQLGDPAATATRRALSTAIPSGETHACSTYQPTRHPGRHRGAGRHRRLRLRRLLAHCPAGDPHRAACPRRLRRGRRHPRRVITDGPASPPVVRSRSWPSPAWSRDPPGRPAADPRRIRAGLRDRQRPGIPLSLDVKYLYVETYGGRGD